MARADSWNFEDVSQEVDTLELAPPLGKPEPEIKDSANHHAMFKRFLEDETMMLNMMEFVGGLELKCSWICFPNCKVFRLQAMAIPL